MASVAVSDPMAKLQFLGWGGDDDIPCNSTQLMRWGGWVGMMTCLARAQMGLASQADRPKPLVGHGKDVPQSQVESQLRTSRSQNKQLKTNGSEFWKCEADNVNVDIRYGFPPLT